MTTFVYDAQGRQGLPFREKIVVQRWGLLMTGQSALHDAEITGVHFTRASNELVFSVSLPHGRLATLEFSDAVGWSLSPFERQNVIFSVAPRDWSEFDSDFDFGAVDPEVARSEYKVFELEASNGLGGLVFAKSFRLVAAR